MGRFTRPTSFTLRWSHIRQNVINESALVESKSLRHGVLGRTNVLDKVTALSLLPDGMHVTTAMVAAYFEVAVSPDMQRFVGAAKVLHSAEVALFVATCPFTSEALSIATETRITVVLQ